MAKKLTKEQFIEKARLKHGDKYNYDKVLYINNYTKVVIICPEHGDFLQNPNNHLNSNGCPLCNTKFKKLTTQEFIEKAKLIHGDKYDYSKVKYVNKKTKVIISCSLHGEFKQTPDSHINSKNGCPLCSKSHKNLTTEQWVLLAKIKHNNKYNYDKTIYTKGHSKLIITCSEHGDFEQQATSHLMGCGCPKCRDENLRKSRLMTQEEFIQRANKIHNNKYDYSKLEYKNIMSKIKIICPIHGEFEQIALTHLNGHGCKACNKFCIISKGEKLIKEYLSKLNYNSIELYAIKIDASINPSGFAYVDFYLPDHNIIIEYNGEQHYKDTKYFTGYNFERQQKRDTFISNYCLLNNIKLIEISYKLNEIEIIELLNNKLAVKASKLI